MFLSVRQVAERIGISASLVYELCKAGLLAHTRHGRPGKRGCIRIADDALAAYMVQCRGERRQDAAFLGLKHITLT